MVEALHNPWTSPNQVLCGRRTLEDQFSKRNDRRAVFATAYAWMTEFIERDVASGVFEDPDWIAQLTVIFAETYRQALAQIDRGAPAPACWRLAVEAGQSGTSLVIQDLVLGLIAHIEHDLTLALAEATMYAWRARCERDYQRILSAIARSIDTIQDHVAARYAPGLCLLDHLACRLDEWVIYLAIRAHRDRAWSQAMGLIDRPHERTAVQSDLDAGATLRCHRVLSLRPRRVFRRVEELDVRRIPGLRRTGLGIPRRV